MDGLFQLRIKLNDTDPPKIMDLDTFESTEFIIEMMIGLIETDEMKAVIAKAMDDRRKERLENMGATNDIIEIPKAKQIIWSSNVRI